MIYFAVVAFLVLVAIHIKMKNASCRTRILLALELADHPLSGRDLTRLIDASISETYWALDALEKKGLVKSESCSGGFERGFRDYLLISLTSEGWDFAANIK